MTTELALVVSILAIAVAVWFYFHAKNNEAKGTKVCAKARKLRKLGKAVKRLTNKK
jgi:hypothetical protein